LSKSLPAKLYRALRRALAASADSRRRTAFVRELFFRLARRFTPVILVESKGGRFLVSTADHGVGMTLFMGEGAEQRALERAHTALDAVGCRAPGTMIADVGANIGTVAVPALNSFGYESAICFEPVPSNLELLELNLASNGLRERAEVIEVALSDRAGTASFEIATMNPSDARVRTDVEGSTPCAYGEESWETIEVPTATFDSVLESGEVLLDRLGLVWIDAQGHEARILAGASRLLAADIPVVIEFWPYGLRRAGGLESLLETISTAFGLFLDLDDPDRSPRPATEVAQLASAYSGLSHTDLLLIP
jgi:FkbM family methyltransferase